MKKNQLLLVLMVLPLTLSAHDIAVENADGVTIYYNYINNNKELEVTFRGDKYNSYDNEYTDNIVIPNEVTYMNRTRKVTTIGEEAFKSCYGLTSVTIGSGVTSIGEEAFDYCIGLQKVIVPDIAAWCGIKFNNIDANPLKYARHLYSDENTEIKDLVIPSGLTSIANYAFYECDGLTSVSIPNSVTSIGSWAFFECSGLTSITIDSGVTSIGNSAFQWCSGLTSITIPNSVTSIGDSAFSGCEGLTSVAIGNGVKSIGDSAFSNCKRLTSITIGNSVISIGLCSFQGCINLRSVTIGNSVTSIGECAFERCSVIEKVIIYDIAAWCGIKFGDIYANPLMYAHHLYSDENTEIMDLVIPNNVTSIANYAFYECDGLTSVSIPNSVTSIGGGAFTNCFGLTSITIPNSVTSIGGGAFTNCSGLTSITIPNSVTSIGSGAFENCSGLTSIAIPNSVMSIRSCTFFECSGLTSITIPNSVTTIGYGAFLGCTGLTSVTIGSGVTSISDNAFDGADIPTIISLIENPLPINGKSTNNRSFSLNTFNNSTLYVPVGTIDKYKATEGWQDFEHIVEGIPAGINEVEKTNNNKTAIYDLNGVRLSEPKRGVNIVNGKKIVVN